jgi:hypothetical protein
MCDPVTLFGTSAAGIAGGGAAVGGISTVGLIGSQGAFSLATGSLTSGLYSAVSNMGASSLLALGSFGASAYGQAYSAGIAEQNMLRQAQIMDYNAVVRENNAMMAEYAAEREADTFERRMSALMGTLDPETATSNVVINQGSPLLVAENLSREAALERLAILNRGEVEAYAQRAGAASETSAAAAARANAGQFSTGAGIGILSDAFDTGRSLLRNA